MRAHLIAVALIASSFVRAAHAEEPSAAEAQPAPTAPTSSTTSVTSHGLSDSPSPSSSSPAAKATVTIQTQSPGYAAGAPAADRPSAPSSNESLEERRLLTGFRLGYLYVFDHKKPLESLGGQSLTERTGMRSPHQFLIGYEAFYRMLGNSNLNVLLVGNAMISGLEQSRFYPSVNGLIGFEFRNSFQLGVGVNVTPLKGSTAHTIVAAGWTPRSGNFYVPIHAFFVPDVDGAHRVGITTGVTF